MSWVTAMATARAHAWPGPILLLYTDRADPVAKVLLEQASHFDREVLALSLAELVEDVIVGPTWTWAGHSIEPSCTAVVNRIVSLGDSDRTGPLHTRAALEQFWGWLSVELERFAYVSSMPSAISPIGSFGSLLDQWLDVPERVAGTRVPAHCSLGTTAPLSGDVHVVDPWQLYSLGRRPARNPEPVPPGHVAFVRPAGKIFHVAQIGEKFMIPNAPPQMSPSQYEQVASFTRTIAGSSCDRILEHAFFDVEDGLVFYSSCPVPMITGRFAAYSNFVVAGLQDDLRKRSDRARA